MVVHSCSANNEPVGRTQHEDVCHVCGHVVSAYWDNGLSSCNCVVIVWKNETPVGVIVIVIVIKIVVESDYVSLSGSSC